MNKSLLKKYQKMIKDDYNETLNEDNYKEIITEEFKENKELKNYFKNYIEKNSDKIDYQWAVIMYLFTKASNNRNVTLVEEYYKELKSYESNYYLEYILGDINLMYYGNLFEAKDRFLKSLSYKENDTNAYYNLGFIYNLLGVFSKSLEYYNKTIYFNENSVNPKKIKLNALYNVGTYYINVEKDSEKAKEIFEDVLKEDSENIPASQALKKLEGEM